MCGINGILTFQQQRIDPAMLQQMGNAMEHRGPDADGMCCLERVGLGFRWLSVGDTDAAQQPIANEDEQVWMVCNGEIYNDQALRHSLRQKGHRFRTNMNTEVIVHLYEEYGSACVHHLQGMFAFIIWDRRTATLLAARDHFGIKPLYYTHDTEKLLLSSELKSILRVNEHGRTNELDAQSIIHYLTYQYVPEPRTMVEGVHKLPPAHTLIVQGKAIDVERYWSPTFEPGHGEMADFQMRTRKVVHDSVRRHMHSDGPVGSFLSSGIDSTAIAALANSMHDEPLATFSVGFEGERNECTVARQTANVLGTTHHERIITERDYFQTVDQAIWSQGDPVADPSAIALNILSAFAAEHVKVVLSGEGADELFGGYRIYQEPFALRYMNWLPKSVQAFVHGIVRSLPHFKGKNYLLRATTPLEKRFIGNAKIFTDDMNELLSERVRHEWSRMGNAFQWAEQYYAEVAQYDDVTKMQFIDLNLWLPGNILAKADKMSMAHSLELRVPFLDRDVFEVARTIPMHYRINQHTTKRVLREAFADVVPAHVLHRPKLGFPVPLRDWLRGKRGDDCLEVIRSSALNQYMDMHYVERIVRSHQQGKRDHSRKIWTLYTLARWELLYLEKGKTTRAYTHPIESKNEKIINRDGQPLTY